MLGVDRAGIVQRTAEWIDDASDELMANRNFQNASGATNLIPFLELEVVTKNNGADVVFLEIQSERCNLLASFGGRDLEHLASHGLSESVNAGDSVLHFQDGADFLDVELVQVRRFDLAEENVLDLAGAQNGFSGHCIRGTGDLGHGGSRNGRSAGKILLVKFITSGFLGQRRAMASSHFPGRSAVQTPCRVVAAGNRTPAALSEEQLRAERP